MRNGFMLEDKGKVLALLVDLTFLGEILFWF
jgi:hypothetical protein